MNIQRQQLNLLFQLPSANRESGRLSFADKNSDEHNVLIQLSDKKEFHKRQHKLSVDIKVKPVVWRLDYNKIW